MQANSVSASTSRRDALRLFAASLAGGAISFGGVAKAQPAAEPAGAFSVTVDGVSIHGVDLGQPGSPTDPAVILIHGAGANLGDWTFSFAERLTNRHRVLIFDRPGFGKSERPLFQAGDPRAQAALLADAATALGVRRFVLVGHSWGGAVAMAWALRHPNRTAGVVAVAGATMPWEVADTLSYLGEGVATVRALFFGGGGSAAETALNRFFQPQRPPSGYIRHMGYQAGFDAVPIFETADDLWTLRGALADMAPRYARFEPPVTIVHGDRDNIVPLRLHGQRLARAVSNAELLVLPGLGHMPHHFAPEEIVAAIDRHVAADRAARRR